MIIGNAIKQIEQHQEAMEGLLKSFGFSPTGVHHTQAEVDLISLIRIIRDNRDLLGNGLPVEKYSPLRLAPNVGHLHASFDDGRVVLHAKVD